MDHKKSDNTESLAISKKMAEVKNKLSQQDFLSTYTAETISNFAFRYFDNPQEPEQIATNKIRIIAVDDGYLKTNKLNLPMSDRNATIMSEITVTFDKKSGNAGVCKLTARISYGYPHHHFLSGTFLEKSHSFNFEDEMHFRNLLAKELEIVCELF